MKKIILIGVLALLLLISISNVLATLACYESISVFGINEDYGIEWRDETTMHELQTGYKYPKNENVTTILIVYNNILLYSINITG